MFITTINTSYKHFGVFNIRKTLLEMQEFFKNNQTINCAIPDSYESFWNNALSYYESYSDYVYSLSTYEFNLLKQISYKNAYFATFFAFAIDEQIPELEPLIATSAHSAYEYALFVLKGRFELGEAIIATDAYCACNYARNVLKVRFELGENVILSSKFYKDEYIAYFPDCLTNSIET